MYWLLSVEGLLPVGVSQKYTAESANIAVYHESTGTLANTSNLAYP